MKRIEFFVILFFCVFYVFSQSNPANPEISFDSDFSEEEFKELPLSSATTTVSPTSTTTTPTTTTALGQKPVYTPEQERLRITIDDVLLVPERNFPSKGYHLYIRKKPGIESVLLTETTKDPTGQNDNYAYRAMEFNSVNGNEMRYLDGKPLASEWSKFSLVDSTTEECEPFGEAFHIYIPSKLKYGYPWSRSGEIEIGKGTFINIRTFEKKYADYSGNFMDNPFMFDLRSKKSTKVVKNEPPANETQNESVSENENQKNQNKENQIVAKSQPNEQNQSEENKNQSQSNATKNETQNQNSTNQGEDEETILTDDYNPVASDKFQEIAKQMVYSKGPKTIVSDIMMMLDDIRGPADVVLAIDTTGSMKDDLDILKKDLVPALKEKFKGKENIRLGLLFYRDYGDNYNYNGLPVRFYEFTDNFDVVQKNLNSVKINGREGGDIPEAVYESLYASVKFYKWSPSSMRKIILVGDAQPHPSPRGSGKYSRDFVMQNAMAANVQIDAILLPDKD